MAARATAPTDRHELETDQLRRLFLSAHDMFSVAGMDGYFKHINPAFTRVLGYSEQELTSLPWIEFVHPEDRNVTATEGDKLAGGETTIYFKNRYITKSGKMVWMSWTAVPDVDAGLIYAVARDVTEQVQSEARYQTIFRESPAAILELDHSGVFEGVKELRESGVQSLRAWASENPESAASLVARTRLVAVNKATLTLFQAESEDQFIHEFPATLDETTLQIFLEQVLAYEWGDKVFEGEATALTLANHKLFLRGHSRLLPGHEDDWSRAILTLVDLTERKRTADELERMRDNLEEKVKERTRELSEMNRLLEDQIHERKQAQEQASRWQQELSHASRISLAGEMVSGIAHELHQPLTAVFNYARGCQLRLERGEADLDEFRVIANRIVTEAQRAATIVRRLSDFVRKREFLTEKVDLNHLVDAVRRYVHLDLAEEGIRTYMELEPQLPAVAADRVQIEQVLLNLIRNGAEAMKESPRFDRELFIRTRRLGVEWAEVVVRDSGAGLTPEELDRIFEPFFTTKSHGMGIGLSICRTIVEAHGGKLQGAMNSTKGAVFRFSLPIWSEEPLV